MTKNELGFAVFCIESIAEHVNENGAAIYRKLKHNSDILDTYIIPHYDALHSQGKEYIVEELTALMREEGLL